MVAVRRDDMSLIGKLFGRRSASEERLRGEELRARGELGLAKLAYERALELSAGEAEELRQALRAEVNACRDGLARARIAEAERLLLDGALEMAVVELEAAAEMAADTELAAEAERQIESVQRREARERVNVPEQAQDERFETIAGSWDDAQYDEYAGYGEELRAALLALYDGNAREARPVLERLAQSADAPCYLLFELGRARLLDGDTEAGREALKRFVGELGPEQGGESRLVAHMELAALHQERGAIDDAAAEYEAAVEALPEDPRPYLAMATFLRRQGLSAEAVEVLGSALDALEDEGQRQWRLTLELGLAYAELGEDERATALLEDVIGYLTARQHMDLPPECAVPLAQLHEKAGNKARALDLYNLLAVGSDVGNHFVYYREAARLMAQLGHRVDARRMLQRAKELLPDDPEARAALERQHAELK
jgi:tetratricopeptide (TPR) repeat protein